MQLALICKGGVERRTLTQLGSGSGARWKRRKRTSEFRAHVDGRRHSSDKVAIGTVFGQSGMCCSGEPGPDSSHQTLHPYRPTFGQPAKMKPSNDTRKHLKCPDKWERVETSNAIHAIPTERSHICHLSSTSVSCPDELEGHRLQDRRLHRRQWPEQPCHPRSAPFEGLEVSRRAARIVSIGEIVLSDLELTVCDRSTPISSNT